jgi:AraC-like DNA-binding protein
VRVERHETEASSWELAHRPAPAALRPFLLADLEGWAQRRGRSTELREVPFPGVPLILNLGEPWDVAAEPNGHAAGERHDSFVAGLHTQPTFVRGGKSWASIELRLTPLGTRRLLGIPMDELANRTVALADVLPKSAELNERIRESRSWTHRFALVEAFLMRRLADSTPPLPAVEWAWEHLRRAEGGVPIQRLAAEIGWSHRRLIARFREQVGLAPKTFARLVRFDRAVSALRASAGRSLAEIAFECGYFDQSHMNREFRELAGTTPALLAARTDESGAVAA